MKGIQEQFTVSKVEEDKFRFTGLDCKGRKWKDRSIYGGLCKFNRGNKGNKEGR